MSGKDVVSLVIKWGPVVLNLLPKIIKCVQDLYALFREMTADKGTTQEKDRVLTAMKLLNKFKDDTNKLLQDPELKNALLEGLSLLMRRINSKGKGQTERKMISASPSRPSPQEPYKGADCGASNPSHSFSSSSPSFSKSSSKRCFWMECDECLCGYNLTNRRPTILICGHTFCRECVADMGCHEPVKCPVCWTLDGRPVDALPSNAELIWALEEEDQDNDVCCSGGGGGSDSCEGMTMTFEEQIEYAILLSQQEAQSRGAAYVEASWREVLEAEDEMLARAIHESEVYEYSQKCGQQEAEAAAGGLYPSDKVEWEEYGACGGGQTEPASPGDHGEDDEASLRLALELHQQEVVDTRRQCSSSSNGTSSCGVASSCDAGWLKEHQYILGTTLCGSVGKEGETEQEERREEEAAVGKEEGEHTSEEQGAVCCNISREEETRDNTQEDGCEGKCSEDDCTKEGKEECSDECSAFLRDEEELHIQMAIRASLKEQEGCTAAPTDQE